MWIIDFLKSLFAKEKKEPEDTFPGCLPPLKDYRDILGSALIKETLLPTEYKIPYSLKVKDQNGYPRCVAYSSSLLKEEKELREKNDIEFDADWLYAECKKIDNYSGKGTMLNMPFKVMINKGIKILGGNETDIDKYKIGGYVALDDLTPDGIKRAIYQWGAVIVGFNYSKNGWLTEYVRAPRTGERIVGHAVALIGWNKDYIIGQNSFGKLWGKDGLFFIPKDYIPFAGFAIVVDLPNNWKELLTDETTKPKYVFKNNLGYGMINDEVKKLQDALKYLGCMLKSQESTGYYGQLTIDGVVLFQKRYGINPTGFFANLSRAKMNELLL